MTHTQKVSKMVAVGMGIAVAFSGSALALAQTDGASTAPSVAPTRQRVMDARREIEAIKKTNQQTISNDRAELRNDIKAIREQVKTGSTSREEVRQEIKDRVTEGRAEIKNDREKAKQEIEARRQQIRSEVDQRRANEIAKMANTLVERYTAAYDRLVGIKNRIATRISEVTARGGSVGNAQTALDKATPLLAVAQTNIDDLKTVVAEATGSASSTEARMAIRTKSEEVKASIKTAHAGLVDAIVALKPGRPNASSTPATVTNTNATGTATSSN
jgi:DNA anti-recombination protein RmuC